MSTRLTKAQRLLRVKQCAECDRKADASTIYPDKAVRRCMAHWVAYYRRRHAA